MPDIRLAQFPRNSRAQIRLYNLAATRRPHLQLDIAGEAAALQPAPLANIPSDPVALTAGSGSAWLTLAPTLFERWLRPWTGGEALTHLPPALRNAARQAALTPLFDALKTATGMLFNLTDLPAPTPESAIPLGLWLTDETHPSGVLRLDDPAAAVLATHLERLPITAMDQEPWPNLPVAVTPWIGQTRLTLAEFQQIESGDILLLSPSMSDAMFELILRQARRPLAVARFLNPRQLCIDRLAPTAMSEHELARAADAPPSALNPDDLDIRIDFDLGHLTLPLRELRAIQPGYSFELDQHGPQPVRLVSGSQVIGYGELVQIDDRLGVRVTALLQSSE